MQSILTVPKETIGNTTFATHDVLSCRQEVEKRKLNLQKALTLGNLYRHKVAIIYQLRNKTEQRVITTVWALTEHHVTLKGGRNIPIHAITEVEL